MLCLPFGNLKSLIHNERYLGWFVITKLNYLVIGLWVTLLGFLGYSTFRKYTASQSVFCIIYYLLFAYSTLLDIHSKNEKNPMNRLIQVHSFF